MNMKNMWIRIDIFLKLKYRIWNVDGEFTLSKYQVHAILKYGSYLSPEIEIGHDISDAENNLKNGRRTNKPIICPKDRS